MNTIETIGLSHQFSKGENILKDIHLQVKEGSIYGFLGPNGAGKTTTLRLILGLLRRQQGEIKIFGKSFDQNRLEILRGVGSLIESPSLYGQLTAAENLLIWQKVYQCPKSRIEHVLKLVGLADTGRKKASQFSLGMKQRLSIAVALLHNPKLLILDEPTNGLDPSGIVEMRELLKTLNRENGITILISSHLLGEIEKLVTDVGIINKGKMLFEGSLDALLHRQRTASQIIFDTNRPTETLALMMQHTTTAQLSAEKVILPALPKSTIAHINQQLVAQNIEVYGIQVVQNDLEDIFMDLTNN
jgi:lantibiotic transport system ATP-binding protein